VILTRLRAIASYWFHIILADAFNELWLSLLALLDRPVGLDDRVAGGNTGV